MPHPTEDVNFKNIHSNEGRDNCSYGIAFVAVNPLLNTVRHHGITKIMVAELKE